MRRKERERRNSYRVHRGHRGQWNAYIQLDSTIARAEPYDLALDGVRPVTTTPNEDMEATILSIIAAQEAAWCAGDAEAFGASALPDVVFTNIVGMFSVGLEAFNAQHAHIFSTIYKGSRLSQSLVHVTRVTADVAIIDTLTTVTGYHHLPPGVFPIDGALKSRLEQVLLLKDGAWRVQSFHNVAVNPAAGAIARPGAA